MNSFLKKIFTTDHNPKIIVDNGGGGGGGGGGGEDPGPVAGFSIGSLQTIKTNGCVTQYSFTVDIPSGYTAEITGTLEQGNFGNSVRSDTYNFIGTRTLAAGSEAFLLVLGNSGIQYSPSTYKIRAVLSNDEAKQIFVYRTSYESSLYDQNPC